MKTLFAVAVRQALLEATLPRKGEKYKFFITGDDRGSWDLSDRLDFRALTGKWFVSASLSRQNEWRNLSVENATEHHQGFRKAFQEIVKRYPELMDWVIRFDGPYMPVRDLVGGATEFEWSTVTFYHGTSWYAWTEFIQEQGLRPRSVTRAGSAYGRGVGAKEGRTDAIYLTTQIGMARFAASDAARQAVKDGHTGGTVILKVVGLNKRHVAPDEDSGEQDPRKSLEKIGSIAYTASIPVSHITVVETSFPALKAGWTSPQGLTSLNPAESLFTSGQRLILQEAATTVSAVNRPRP